MAVSKALVLIMGANQGIGLATAQQLVSSGKYHVLLGSRSHFKADAAIQTAAGRQAVFRRRGGRVPHRHRCHQRQFYRSRNKARHGHLRVARRPMRHTAPWGRQRWQRER